jgi:DNA gyrase subunit A
MANLLPLANGETISTVLPLPENEDEWGKLHVMFATAHGYIRRNSMDAFTNVPSNGKLAIRFEDGDEDRLIGVALCDEADDALLASRCGKAIRFSVTDVREFQSRTSTGVRGMSLVADGDEVISLSILKGFDATTEERDAYLRGNGELAPERVAEFKAAEQFILTVTANGYGKRTSAYAYRRTGRGGQGITNIDTSDRNGHVVASFPVEDDEHLMLVTDQGKLIRTEVNQVRVLGRATQGVTLFRVGENEHVVSAAKIRDEDEEEKLAEEVAAE